MWPTEAEGRIFVNLQAFIDDSYDKEGVFVLGGCIASARDWAAFSKDWEKALPRYGVLGPKDRHRFKMSEMAALDDRMNRVPIFFSIIEKHVLAFVSARIEIQALRRVRERISVPGCDLVWDEYADPFYITFRCLMDKFHLERAKMVSAIPIEEKIDFIFDMQSQKGIIYRVWDNYLKHRPEQVAKFYGSPPRFEDDDEYLPLQAADFWAWWVRKWTKEMTPEKILNPSFSSFERPRGVDKKYLRIDISFTEDDLVKSLVRTVRLAVGPDRTIYDSGKLV